MPPHSWLSVLNWCAIPLSWAQDVAGVEKVVVVVVMKVVVVVVVEKVVMAAVATICSCPLPKI